MSLEQEKKMPVESIGDVHELGLCYTCNTVKTCTGRKTWIGPVFHCEEFSDVNGGLTQPVAKLAPAAVRDPAPAAEAANPRMGLCVNCAHRDGCGFPIVEGGTWHCEEYE